MNNCDQTSLIDLLYANVHLMFGLILLGIFINENLKLNFQKKISHTSMR